MSLVKIGEYQIDFGAASKEMDDAVAVLEVNAKMFDHKMNYIKMNKRLIWEIETRPDEEMKRSFSLILCEIAIDENNKASNVTLNGYVNCVTNNYHELAVELTKISQLMGEN